ncbi:gamma carbonic anhydrase family protein [Runella salmonicolor]|uniref:Gamma carbonic anhydrase family protein n=1 Tax=Runella salmonicolor TaxID=2950278 RepID=A0ABT1FW43_9BACT|nr:gamma carbonic anhydrase family protein [Runella salmonicolor]MCP1385986.1 gamma carbonic anhydrase family protein [Runella salmonicolor]
MDNHKAVFIASSASVMGQVSLGEQASVWYGAVIRADVEKIIVGHRTNIQDTAVLHADEGSPTIIGDDVTVGHGAIVHGATVGNGSLIGMRATILNNAKIGKFCIIGAHALVTEGMEVPDFSMVLGTPGKVVKQLPESMAARLLESAAHYVAMGQRHASGEFPMIS